MNPDVREEDRDCAAAILRARLTTAQLRETIDDLRRGGRSGRSVEAMVASAVSGTPASRLPEEEYAAFLVDLLGSDLLANRFLRRLLLRSATDADLWGLLDYWGDEWQGRNHDQVAGALAAHAWHPGKGWAAAVVECLGLPMAFTGARGDPRPPDHIDVDAYAPLPELEDYQRQLLDDLVGVFRGGPRANRALVELPTGSGKTRVAVEALLADWVQRDRAHAILWIAHSEELCEQAVQCFIDVWTDLGHRGDGIRGTLPIDRVWGGRPVPRYLDAGLAVASIQQLYSDVIKSTHDAGRWLGDLLEVVVVDEAHRATAASYRDVLKAIGIPPRVAAVERPALIGLTATPYRGNQDETNKLRRRFLTNELVPAGLGTTPEERRQELIRRGVLAEIDQETLISTTRVELPARETAGFSDDRLDERALRQLAGDVRRNRALMTLMLKLPEDWPVLVFACSVNHAQALSMLLRRAGRSASFISGDTRGAARRASIEGFRDGTIQFLCNFNVLTTGFDAPRARAVVMARPTESPVLYMQMVGRGLRGPRFGGTERCLVIDVVDSISVNGNAITSIQMAEALRAENAGPGAPPMPASVV